jgi:hypothetical protein
VGDPVRSFYCFPSSDFCSEVRLNTALLTLSVLSLPKESVSKKSLRSRRALWRRCAKFSNICTKFLNIFKRFVTFFVKFQSFSNVFARFQTFYTFLKFTKKTAINHLIKISYSFFTPKAAKSGFVCAAALF